MPNQNALAGIAILHLIPTDLHKSGRRKSFKITLSFARSQDGFTGWIRENKSAPLAGLKYNLNPVTARIRQNRTGIDRVEVEITQIVRGWLHQGVPNHGVLMVSHRTRGEKTLRENHVAFPHEPRSKITIYYTILDE